MKRKIGLLINLSLLLILTNCEQKLQYFHPQPDAFEVTIKSDRGSPQNRIEYGQELLVNVDIKARDGKSFNNYVQLFSVPGEVSLIEAEGYSIFRNQIKLINGEALNLIVHIRYAYGDTRLWVEDIGLEPSFDINGSKCNDGKDNDNDGYIDFPLDPGCFWINDNNEDEGTDAVGVSETIYVMNPTLSDVQGYTTLSPFVAQGVRIDRGELYVTRVSINGFNVTDISKCSAGNCSDGGFAHIFAYNFNPPPGLRVCDKLLYVEGIVGEFYGYTELNFPSWEVDPAHPRPEPKEMTPELCPINAYLITERELANPLIMESFESALVEIRNVTILEPNPEQYAKYGQYPVELPDENRDGRKGIIYVITNMARPDFNPFRHIGDTIQSITGTLKQFAPLDNPWIIEARCTHDIRLQGEREIPIHRRCVPSLVTGKYEDPY